MVNIKDFPQKIKSLIIEYKEEILTAIFVSLVGFGSFGLGILYERGSNKANNSFIENSFNEDQGVIDEKGQGASVILPKSESDSNNKSSQVVGSKSGSKYHFPWCSGAQRIKDENKIFFSSIEEARKAGYTPAANCKGLE